MRDRHSRLPGLQTFSLEGIFIPEAVVKDWRRRQHHGLGGGAPKKEATSNGGGVNVTKESGEREVNMNVAHAMQRETFVPGETAAETALRDVGGEAVDDVSGGAVAGAQSSRPPNRQALGVARRFHRIKKIMPEDERGIWLLNSLLEQVSLFSAYPLLVFRRIDIYEKKSSSVVRTGRVYVRYYCPLLSFCSMCCSEERPCLDGLLDPAQGYLWFSNVLAPNALRNRLMSSPIRETSASLVMMRWVKLHACAFGTANNTLNVHLRSARECPSCDLGPNSAT